MRKRLAIIGHSEEGIALIPLLEANPDSEVFAILTTDPDAAMRALRAIEPGLAERFAERLTTNPEPVFRAPGLVALVDAQPEGDLRRALDAAADRGMHVTTPLIAKLLYAFGPIDASRKPNLLHTLSEMLESYDLTVDRDGLHGRILQIAVGATGADRGSLMLFDEASGQLRVEVAIGIEKEVLRKIRVAPGEGIAGRAYATRRAILVHGKADHARYEIVRERDDVESAISAPLLYDGRLLGVLNLSHGRARGAFDSEDLKFVEQLAALNARIIARAQEYHELRLDSMRLRAQSQVRSLLSGTEPLIERLRDVCRFAANELDHGLCRLFMLDALQGELVLHCSSAKGRLLSAPARFALGEGIAGWVAEHHEPVMLSNSLPQGHGCLAVIPLLYRDELVGVLSIETVTSKNSTELTSERIRAITDTLSEGIYEALREARMEREAIKLAAIAESTSAMRRATDATELYRAITSAAAMIMEAEYAVLRLQDTTSSGFQIRSYFGSEDPDSQGPLFTLEKDLSIRAIQHQGPALASDVASDPALAAHDCGIETALSWPLRRGGRIIGTLSVLGKVGGEPLGGEYFDALDEALLGKLAEPVQQIIDQAQERESTRHHQRFDAVTGLANITMLRERLEQEISRSSQHERKLVVVRLQLLGLDQLISAQSAGEADRLVISIAQELRGGLRDFDILARTSSDTFLIVVPESDGDASRILGPLARRVGEAIARDDDASLQQAGLRIELGYAVYPDEGRTTGALLKRAESQRITQD